MIALFAVKFKSIRNVSFVHLGNQKQLLSISNNWMFKRDEFLHGKLLTEEKVAHQFFQNFRYQQQCKKRFCGSFHLGHQTHTHTQWLNKSKHNIKGKYRCQWFHDTIPFKFTTNKSNYRYRIMQIKNEKQMHGMAWNEMCEVKRNEKKNRN